MALRCSYCEWRDSYLIPGLSLGRCRCRGKHVVYVGADQPDDVVCNRCGHVSERLTARLREEREQQANSQNRLTEHECTQHRPEHIVDRMIEVERESRYEAKEGRLTDADWRDHPLAVEYRALLREWWGLTGKAYAQGFKYLSNRPVSPMSLVSASVAPNAWRGARAKIVKLRQSANVLGRVKVGETEYIFFPEQASHG